MLGGCKRLDAEVTHEDWLQTLAEVAVALAGFSGLLAGIRQRSERHSRINITRLRTIVETSLSVLAFSLLPTLLSGLGVSEIEPFESRRSPSWQASSLLPSRDFTAFVLRPALRR